MRPEQGLSAISRHIKDSFDAADRVFSMLEGEGSDKIIQPPPLPLFSVIPPPLPVETQIAEKTEEFLDVAPGILLTIGDAVTDLVSTLIDSGGIGDSGKLSAQYDQMLNTLADGVHAAVGLEKTPELLESIDEVLKEILANVSGNQLQQAEDKREMLDVLSSIGEENKGLSFTSTPEVSATKSSAFSGLVAGITASVTTMFSKMIPKLFTGLLVPFSFLGKKLLAPFQKMFAPVIAFFTKFLGFGKTLIKFAGPIGLAISIITGLIGAIRGGMRGFEEDGITGMIKEGVIGGIDMLIGNVVRILADAVGWVLEKFGMAQTGKMFGDVISNLLDSVYEMFRGLIDTVVGLFTLDEKKFVGGLAQIADAIIDIVASLTKFLVTFLIEAIPILWKGIKFALWELPKFIIQMTWKLLEYVIAKTPEFLYSIVTKGIDFLFGTINELVEQFIPEDVTSILQKVADKVFEFINKVVDGFLAFFNDPGQMLGDMAIGIDSFNKKVLAKVLPPRTGAENWRSPSWIVSNLVIPDKVYEYAGLPTKASTGLNDASGGVNPYDKVGERIMKAKAAGYNSWEEYKESGYTWKGPDIKSSPSTSGAMLDNSTSMAAPVIINSMGGNVTNTTTSNISNSTSSYDPIIAGSALGFASV